MRRGWVIGLFGVGAQRWQRAQRRVLAGALCGDGHSSGDKRCAALTLAWVQHGDVLAVEPPAAPRPDDLIWGRRRYRILPASVFMAAEFFQACSA